MITTKEKFFVYGIRDDLKRVWIRTVGTEDLARYWVDHVMKTKWMLCIYTKKEIKDAI
jgi:hypothetical protein